MTDWNLQVSKIASRTNNPIRALVDQMTIEPNPAKEVIKLSLGDPAVYGNLPPPAILSEALKECVDAGNAGYVPATGIKVAKEAIAEKYIKSGIPTTGEQICITSGCSHALQIAISVLCDPGTNILLPQPGFSVYQTICEYLGVSYQYYQLNPKNCWQVDMDSLRKAYTSETRALLINNPSNPCGSVYSAEHLKELVDFAMEKRIPIIADEIYAEMVFENRSFVALASVSEQVPIITCGGLAKQYLVPGYRIGWLALHDKNDIFQKADVRGGVRSVAQVLIGANTLIQAAIPKLLKETPASFFVDTLKQLEGNAKLAFDALNAIEGLDPVKPEGAMYMMVGVRVDLLDIENDVEFSEKLFSEESVMVLPGQCFKFPNYFRIVLCPPGSMIEEACVRIAEFCARHQRVKKARTE